jgi:hypothetical protein
MEDGGSIPTSTLQLNVFKLDNEKAIKLNRLWHSRVPEMGNYRTCYPCYGAEYKDVYYAVAMWSQPIAGNRIKKGEYCLELRRMAISPEAPHNTASRMLAIMTKLIKKEMLHIHKLISYQDTAVHNGTIYKASGWSVANHTEYVSWCNRRGRIDQVVSPKIRWELIIRELKDCTKPPSKYKSNNKIQEVMELGI